MKLKMNTSTENEQVAGHAKAQTVGGKRIAGNELLISQLIANL